MIKKELKFWVYFSYIDRELSLNLYSYVLEKYLCIERGIYEVFYILVLYYVIICVWFIEI